jgi:hypothetical protein
MEQGLVLEQCQELPDWQIVLDAELKHECRAICIQDKQPRLDNVIGSSKVLLTSTHADSVKVLETQWQGVPKTRIVVDQLKPPPDVEVINFKPRDAKNEAELFAKIFARPVSQQIINDPYLYDHERIVERVGAYIDLAQGGNKLEKVKIITKRAGTYQNGTPEEQDKAFNILRLKFQGVQIEGPTSNPEHDRYILLIREDGTKARILIGRGLDFIQSNGYHKSTYIVIQNPFHL